MKYQEVIRLVNEVLGQYQEATIRQIYYRLVSPPYQYMDNTRSMYCSFDNFLTRAREEGLIDWRKIADHTRTAIEPPDTYKDIDDFIETMKYNFENWYIRYRVNFWDSQENYVKVFVEKDALASIVSEVALGWQISTLPGRGYNSFTQLRTLVEQLDGIVKSIIILYLGDFDPTGLDIDRSAAERIKEYAGREDIQFVRIALTEDDITSLPPNPTKETDKRAAAYVSKYGNRCWELDALPPDQLRRRVSESIKQYIDLSKWENVRSIWLVEQKQIKERIDGMWNKE